MTNIYIYIYMFTCTFHYIYSDIYVHRQTMECATRSLWLRTAHGTLYVYVCVYAIATILTKIRLIPSF